MTEQAKHRLRTWTWRLTLVALICLLPLPAWAAPGGKIVSGLFKSFWGKVLLGLLVIVVLPLIIWTLLKEARARKQTLALMHRLAPLSPNFEWLAVRERIADCFTRVHAAWTDERMEDASAWMTDWYWRNQQMAVLDRWKRENLVNHCTVKKVTGVKPLHLAYRNDDGEHGGSRLVVLISATMEDYLAERDTGKVVEGKKGFGGADFVWTFSLEDGQWLVSNIEDASFSLTYAGLPKELPEVLPGATERA